MNASRRAVGAAIFFVLAGLGGSGCAITVLAPLNRFDSPEAEGKLGAGHGDPAAIEGASGVEAVPDDTESPPDLTSKPLQYAVPVYRAAVGVGMTDWLDLELKLPSAGVGLLIAKAQLVGDPKLTATEGNFSIAVSAGAGYGSNSGTDQATGLFSGQTTNSIYTVNYSTYDLAAIFGYRFNRHVVLYGGPFYTKVMYSGSLSQDNTGGSGGNGTFNFGFNGYLANAGGNLGVELDFKVVAVQIEAAAAQTTNDVGGVIVTSAVGANLALHWGGPKPEEKVN